MDLHTMDPVITLTNPYLLPHIGRPGRWLAEAKSDAIETCMLIVGALRGMQRSEYLSSLIGA